MLEAARELKAKETADFFHELCDVAMIPSQTPDYLRDMKQHYRERSDNAVPEFKAIKAQNFMPWEMATALMESAQKQKVRLECGRG